MLTTYLQLIPRSRKLESIHPLPHTPSWRNAHLVKSRNKCAFYLRLYVSMLKLSDSCIKIHPTSIIAGHVKRHTVEHTLTTPRSAVRR
jgi:hypothetical protein